MCLFKERMGIKNVFGEDPGEGFAYVCLTVCIFNNNIMTSIYFDIKIIPF